MFREKRKVNIELDVEVTAKAVEPLPPLKPLPPLPMREVPPFVEAPKCDACGSKKVELAYWPGYHDKCVSGFYVASPTFLYYDNTDAGVREHERRWGEVLRKRMTMPRHHDLACARCHRQWVMAALPVADCD